MQLFLSTTFYGTSSSDINDVLPLLDEFNIDGIELGSTHIYHSDLEDTIRKTWKKRIVTHNFFPPTKDPSFVMNIASDIEKIRSNSITHAKRCIEFASNIGAEVYTIHPGFMSMPDIRREDKDTYDFNFGSRRIKKSLALSLMLDSLNIIIDTAKKFKIKLAIETEGSLTAPGVLLMETMGEYDKLFERFPRDIYLNLNLAHTRFASKEHKYNMKDFINRYYNKIVLVELSHNKGLIDEHKPLVDDTFIFDYLSCLPDVPYILEFRNANLNQIEQSIALMRAHDL